jgi:hypothetical protein
MAIRATVSIQSIQAQTATELVQAQTDYQLSVASEIWTDPDSKNRMISDIIPLADVQFYVLHKKLTDTANLVEFEKWSFEKYSTETVALVESFARVVTYNRKFTDTFTLDDLSQIDKDFYGNKGNVTFMTDIVGLAHEKILADSYSVSDVIVNVITYLRKFTDTVGTTDKVTHQFIKNINDAFTLDDTALINKDFYGNKGNIFTFNDLLGNAFKKNLADSITHLDNISVLQELTKADNVAISDKYETTINKAIADAFTLDDTALIDKDFYGAKGNVFGFSDVLSYTTSKEIADSLALVEVVGFLLNHPEEDTITVSDTTLLSHNLGRPDTLTFSDGYIRNIIKGISDAFTLDDSTQINKDTVNTKGNVFALGEIFLKNVAYKRAVTDNIAFTDALTKTVQFKRSIDDNFGLTEVKGVDFSKKLHDEFSIIDQHIFNGALNVHALNTSTLNGQANTYQGTNNIHLAQIKAKGDGLTFSEIAELGSSKNINDSTVITDQQYTEIQKALQSAANLSDIPELSALKEFTDSTTLDDAVDIKSTKSLTDPTNIHDILGLSFDKVVTDGFALDDSALVNKDYYGNKGNIVTIADVVAVTKVGRRLLNGASFNRTQLN